MKRWKLERKEISLFLLSTSLCGSMIGMGVIRSHWGRHLAALSKRALPLSPADESLLAAVKANDFNAVRLAVESGADVNCQDRVRFQSCLGTASITYYSPLILSTMDSMQARFSRGGRPKHLDIMNYLLEHGADPNLGGSSGTTALYLVSANGDLDAARLLLQADADPNNSASNSDSPLGRACYMGRFEVAKLLRAKGASINQPGELGAMPLHQCVGYKDSPEISRWLISQGADVNVRDSLGNTPLHRAAMYGRVETVRLLVRAGADPYILNSQKRTSFDVASQFAASIVSGQYGSSRTTSAGVEHTEKAMLSAMREKKSEDALPSIPSKSPN